MPSHSFRFGWERRHKTSFGLTQLRPHLQSPHDAAVLRTLGFAGIAALHAEPAGVWIKDRTATIASWTQKPISVPPEMAGRGGCMYRYMPDLHMIG